MILICWFYPLEIGKNREGEMMNTEAAGFIYVEEVGVLGLFLLLHGEVCGVVWRGIDWFGRDHEVIVVLLGQEGVKNWVWGKNWGVWFWEGRGKLGKTGLQSFRTIDNYVIVIYHFGCPSIIENHRFYEGELVIKEIAEKLNHFPKNLWI